MTLQERWTMAVDLQREAGRKLSKAIQQGEPEHRINVLRQRVEALTERLKELEAEWQQAQA